MLELTTLFEVLTILLIHVIGIHLLGVRWRVESVLEDIKVMSNHFHEITWRVIGQRMEGPWTRYNHMSP